MTELDDYETFFTKVHDDFDKIYQKKLAEHKHAISVGLNESEYTEGYGKVDAVLPLVDGIYAVHKLELNWLATEGCGGYAQRNYFAFQIDNWGDFCGVTRLEYGHGGNFGQIASMTFCNRDNNIWKKKCSKYRLPNVLINLVKRITLKSIFLHKLNDEMIESAKILVPLMTEICNMAEHYYKKFTKYESLYKSDRLTSYDELLISHTKMECELTHKIAELEKSVEYWKNKYETSDEQVRLDAQEKELAEYRKQEHEKSIEMERITKKCERLEEIVRTYKQFAKNVKQYQDDSDDES
jgi:hypothetical protein